MWELGYKESRALKNWCFWTVVLQKTLESPLNYKEIQPVHPKGNQSWVFIGSTNFEAETPILWPPDAKSWLIWKDPDAGKDWKPEEKGMTEDEMVGWHHQLNGHGFGWTLGVGDGQGGLAFCGSWGRKESEMIEWLNWTDSDSRSTLVLFYFHPHCVYVFRTWSGRKHSFKITAESTAPGALEVTFQKGGSKSKVTHSLSLHEFIPYWSKNDLQVKSYKTKIEERTPGSMYLGTEGGMVS